MSTPWPELSYETEQDTYDALHLWSQIVGKFRLSIAPWLNHSWHATLYVTPKGLTTGPVYLSDRAIEILYDFHDHRVIAVASTGQTASFPLCPMSTAEFYAQLGDVVEEVGGTFDVHGAPNEVNPALPFVEDTARREYDRGSAHNFHQALVRIANVFSHFRSGFRGKVSPVHLFWGSFDLAVTRFSGRSAPTHPGGIPNLPDDVAIEAYSHEVSSAGFWPGQGIGEAMFYSYCYPTSDAFKRIEIRPELARWDETLGEFLLPYEAVRSSASPEALLLEFLQATYEAAAVTGNWDRPALEYPMGLVGRPPRAKMT